MSEVRRHAIAAIIMPLGATAVLGSVVVMNELSEPPEKNRVEQGTAIEVKKAPPPKKKEEVKKPKPRRKPRSNTPPPPSLAALTSGLAGVAFDLPAFQMEDIGANAGDLLGGDDDVVHTGDTVDKKPQPQNEVPPEFPSDANKRGIEGYVLVSFKINAQGRPEDIRILESKPSGVFDDSAYDAIQQFSWVPAYYKGKPVSFQAEKKFVYELGKR